MTVSEYLSKRGQRKAARQARVEAHWHAKWAAAATPAARALIAWDQARATVRRLPPGDQASAWQALGDDLARWSANYSR